MSDPRRGDQALFVLRTLERTFDSTGAELAVPAERGDPFRVLVSTVISQRTRDRTTRLVSGALFDEAPNVASLAAMDRAVLERILRPSGFHRRKADLLIALARAVVDRHGGKVPRGREDLLALPGVGRKTAALVLWVAFDVPAICVDTHVHRVSNRLGLVKTTSPDRTEDALSEILPREWWGRVNPLMVEFGRRICRPVHPDCGGCGLVSVCPAARRRGVGAGQERR